MRPSYKESAAIAGSLPAIRRQPRTVTGFYRRLGSPLKVRQTADELPLDNLGQVICLPCREETIRGYANVSLLIIDEAARVPDDLYRAACRTPGRPLPAPLVAPGQRSPLAPPLTPLLPSVL
jgi:hypothetical protein